MCVQTHSDIQRKLDIYLLATAVIQKYSPPAIGLPGTVELDVLRY